MADKSFFHMIVVHLPIKKSIQQSTLFLVSVVSPPIFIPLAEYINRLLTPEDVTLSCRQNYE